MFLFCEANVIYDFYEWKMIFKAGTEQRNLLNYPAILKIAHVTSDW